MLHMLMKKYAYSSVITTNVFVYSNHIVSGISPNPSKNMLAALQKHVNWAGKPMCQYGPQKI